MNVWLNPDGTRNRDFRPYIEEEEQANSVYMYNPNGPGFNYGLYTQSQPTCGSWKNNIYNQYPPPKVPSEVVDNTGRLHLRKINLWKHGYKYEQLLPNIFNF